MRKSFYCVNKHIPKSLNCFTAVMLVIALIAPVFLTACSQKNQPTVSLAALEKDYNKTQSLNSLAGIITVSLVDCDFLAMQKYGKLFFEYDTDNNGEHLKAFTEYYLSLFNTEEEKARIKENSEGSYSIAQWLYILSYFRTQENAGQKTSALPSLTALIACADKFPSANGSKYETFKASLTVIKNNENISKSAYDMLNLYALECDKKEAIEIYVMESLKYGKDQNKELNGCFVHIYSFLDTQKNTSKDFVNDYSLSHTDKDKLINIISKIVNNKYSFTESAKALGEIQSKEYNTVNVFSNDKYKAVLYDIPCQVALLLDAETGEILSTFEDSEWGKE